LNDVPVDKLSHEIVFGLNRGYLKSGLPITYLVTADKRIEAEFANDILDQDCTKFCHSIFGEGVINYTFKGGRFSTDAAQGVKLGHSVTIVALQIAYYMGCDPVYIVGMDHYISYDNTKKHQGKQYSNLTTDHNHFSKDYYPTGYKFRYQNLAAVEQSYSEARSAFELAGRKLYNATSRTHLPDLIIPRIALETIL
jgi:hypothetical protein